MGEKLKLRTIEYASGIKIVAWAQAEAGSTFSGRAVWGKAPFVAESTIGLIREGSMPLENTAEEAVDMAILEVTKLIRLGVMERS